MDPSHVKCDLYCGEGYHLDPNEICSCVSDGPTFAIAIALVSVVVIAIVGTIIFLIKRNKKGKK